MKLFIILFLANFLVTGSCISQSTLLEQKGDSLSKAIGIQHRRDSLSKSHSFKDVEMGAAFVYSIDGLIISQRKYDALNIAYKQIKKRAILSKSEGKNVYGERGQQGVIAVSAKQIIILNKSVLKKEERSAKLSTVDEKDIETLRNLDAKELLSQVGIKHRWGAIVIETVLKR